jgi:hypothetical protein
MQLSFRFLNTGRKEGRKKISLDPAGPEKKETWSSGKHFSLKGEEHEL